MSEKRIECSLCRTGTYPHFGYTGSGVCDHCGAEWTYDEGDTLTEKSMRELWGKAPRWIPVGERTPEDREQCLVARGEAVGVAWWHSEPKKFIHEDIDNAWIPAHWMPIPSPPADCK